MIEAFQTGAKHRVDGELIRLDIPQVTAEEISLFFAKWGSDERIRFSYFAEAFRPSHEQAAEMLERRNANPPGYPFS